MRIDAQFIALAIFILFWVLVIAVALSVLLQYIFIRARLRAQVNDARDSADADSISDLGYLTTSAVKAQTSRLNRAFPTILVPQKYGPQLRQKLVQAGFFDPSAIGAYFAIRFSVALGLPIATLIIIEVLAPDSTVGVKLLLPIAFALIGFFVPDYYLSRRTAAVQDECRRGFPDLLDLLVVSTDAGLSLEAAMARVGAEIIRSYPALGANIHFLNLEMRAGRDFGAALQNLVLRVGIDEIRAFATLLQQSRELGSSITQALRVYSEDMRHQRMSRAEEKAHSLPVRLVVPLGIFLFPVMMLVALLPVIVRVKSAFFSGN